MTLPARLRVILAAAACAAIAACGGGGGGGGGGNAPLNITSTTIDDGVIGAAYTDAVLATGGSGTRSFSISAGALPDGLSLSTGGVITGTPAGPAGTSNFTVQVTDSATQPTTDTQALTIEIAELLEVTTASVPDTAIGANYSATIEVAGGLTPYGFVLTGDVPSGLSIGTDGVLSGVIAADATTGTFNVEVTDSSSPAQHAFADYTVTVTLEVATTALADATGGVAYSDTLEARGGLPPYDWSLVAGALPAGLSGPNSAGTISGTPAADCDPSTASLTFEVTDSDAPAQTATQAGVDLTVNPATLAFATTALPNPVLDAAYDQTMQATGGVPPYSFAVTAGSLPSGLTLVAGTGRIFGTPDTEETQAFDVTVTDSCPNTATRSFTVTVSELLGRNDSIAQATVLPGNGSYDASISPSGHPNTVLDPDEDFYRITTTATSTVTFDIDAQVLGSPLDAVIEVLDAGGNVLGTCVAPTFVDDCISDDETPGVDLDSFLVLRVTGATTFFIHVVDWGSNARPDKLYTLHISGVN